MSQSNCLFCHLVNVKENVVYEDDSCYVIVDRFPLSNRHLLIIAKSHHSTLTELDDSTICASILLTKKIAMKLKLEKYNLIQNNVNQQQIPHFHIHLIGCNESGSFKSGSVEILKFSDSEYSALAQEIKSLLN